MNPPYSAAATATTSDENHIMATRREKLAKRKSVNAGNAYPNDFRRNTMAATLLTNFNHLSAEDLEAHTTAYKLSGRMIGKRVMGKASFVHLQDFDRQHSTFYSAVRRGR